VREKGAVAYGPPHLTYARARQGAKSMLEYFCEESKLCASQAIGHCTRNSPSVFHCRYSAKLQSGEVCTGAVSLKAGEGRELQESPGLLSADEGECFYLFAPPGLKEEEEAQEAEKGKRSSRATGQPGKQT